MPTMIDMLRIYIKGCIKYYKGVKAFYASAKDIDKAAWIEWEVANSRVELYEQLYERLGSHDKD